MDEIIVQVYRQTSQEVAQTIAYSRLEKASRYVPVAVGIYAGDFDRPKSLQEIKKQIDAATKFGYGYCLFCWEYVFSPLRQSFLTSSLDKSRDSQKPLSYWGGTHFTDSSFRASLKSDTISMRAVSQPNDSYSF